MPIPALASCSRIICCAGPDAVEIELVPSPEDFNFWLAEGIGSFRKNDAVGAVRRLFNERLDSKGGETVIQFSQS